MIEDEAEFHSMCNRIPYSCSPWRNATWDEVYLFELHRRFITKRSVSGWFQVERTKRQEIFPRLNGARKGMRDEKPKETRKKHETNGEGRVARETVEEYYSKYSATLIFCFISNRRDKVKKFSPAKRAGKHCVSALFRRFFRRVFLC